MKKKPYYDYKKLFLFRKSIIISKGNDEEYIKAKYQDGFLKKQF